MDNDIQYNILELFGLLCMKEYIKNVLLIVLNDNISGKIVTYGGGVFIGPLAAYENCNCPIM